MQDSPSYSTNDVLADSTGSSPDVSKTSLEQTERAINSVDQAYSVSTTMVSDWKKGILFSARITAKLNGERPYNQKKLKDAGKDWKTNISTGFLATECARVYPRLFMPIKTAKYLTAASLPNNWPNGLEKTEIFRQAITEKIRSWPKFNFYIRGLAREVGTFGFGFNVFFDEYDWRPTIVRMDKGFVPQGTELMEEPQFFMAKYDYTISELLNLVKASVDSGRSEWQKNNVVAAINSAMPPPVDATYPQARSYEELIRQSTWGYRYTKGNKVIRTYHLFSKEASGKVSHYILLGDADGTPASPASGDGVGKYRLLYENLDQFNSMSDVVNPCVFDFGDGTIHGSWGVGQILYDLAAKVEQIRCDAMDNLRMTNKIKANVAEGKNVNDVKLLVNDQMMIVSGASYAGNTAALSANPEGYELLDQKMTQIAQQKIGAFVPPIPLQPSDIKAAQVNAAMMKERELQESLLENWLIQWAVVVKTITKRLCNYGSPIEETQGFIKKLEELGLTEEEIRILAEEFPVQSVMDFTEFKASQRAGFAQSVIGNPLFNQSVVARTMAGGVGDQRFIDEICIREGDQSSQLAAQRQQLMENAAIALGQPVPVIPQDMDWIHMTTMKDGIGKALESGNASLAQIALQHYAAHYAQGVQKKQIPEDQINSEKGWIAAVEKNIAAIQESAQIDQMRQQAGQLAEQQAAQIVQQEQGMV
jgi:hypothetical protein